MSVAATSLTITDPLIGPGSLVSTGAASGTVATILLAGDNTYAGDTTNAAAAVVLQLGAGGTSGSVRGRIQNNAGAVSYYRSDAYTFTNPLAGNGSFYVRTPAGLTFAPPAPVTSSGTMSVGNISYGQLIVPSGVTMTYGNYFFGDSSGINGDASQLGGTVTVTAQMRVGHWPSAAASTYFMGGGTLSLTALPAGVPNPASGEVGGILYLGIDGTGVFIQTGGVASAHGIVFDARANNVGGGTGNGGIDTLILNGGRFNVGPSALKSGSLDANTSYAIQLGGGTLGSSANWTSVLAMTLTGTNGNTTFDSGSNSNVLTGAIGGPGGLIKTGAGTLALTGSAGYQGGTLVNQGVLLVRGTLGGNLVGVAVNGGTLAGDGTINDAVNVNANGTVSPGTGIAKLSVNGVVTLAGTTLMDINKTGATRTNDQLFGSAVGFGGTLTVTASGDALAPGDAFKLFTAGSYSGAFALLNLPTLSSNYFWDITQLSIDGSIRVAQPMPRITFLRTGNSIELTWSNGFSDFVLQAQTNAFGVGIQSNNWFAVTNGTNSVTLEIDQNNGSVFYRLIKP